VNPEALRTEYELALDAALESDAQVREALQLSAKAQGENPTMTAIDMARIVSTTLALNERLHEQAERHRKALERAEARERMRAGTNQAGA
jgi:hypothetical protein